MRSVLCIFRAACYSPGMVERDEAILRSVAERLTAAGYDVELVHEEEFTSSMPMPDIVLHMARSPHVLDMLHAWHEAGCCVINSPQGVRNVERATLAEWCAAQRIPTPKTWIITTSDPKPDEITFPCWVKRCGTCAQSPDDICKTDDREAYVRCITNFASRHIDKVVVMEHLEGSCIKFYAVPEAGFYFCIEANKIGYDKFTTSSPTLQQDTPAYQETSLGYHNTKDLTCPIKAMQGPLEVFGGDAILGPDGVARLIDLNDWPSFSACRQEATEAIAQLVKLRR